jgi:hypothetical protein
VLVVNEPEVAKAIMRLRGEWAELSGGEVEAVDTTWPDLAKAEKLDADVIVFPSRYLGELCVRGLLRPVRESVLESESVNADDLFPVVQRELMKWGGEVAALPLGIDLVTAPHRSSSAPSMLLLAQAAPNVVSNERLGTLFEVETMKPRMAEPAFVEALQKLVTNEGKGAGAESPDSARVPVLGYNDRLVAVTASSRNTASAFKLLAWLSSADISTQLVGDGARQLPPRMSLASSSRWYDSALSASDRSKFANDLKTALSQDKALIVPRIPGIDDYLAALDDAVNSAVANGVPPEEALAEASRRWEDITDLRGRDEQRQAYMKHLGIDES